MDIQNKPGGSSVVKGVGGRPKGGAESSFVLCRNSKPFRRVDILKPNVIETLQTLHDQELLGSFQEVAHLSEVVVGHELPGNCKDKTGKSD
jgi:hypothetical protein